MIIDFDVLQHTYHVFPSGILHVGAHLGEEAEIYTKMGVSTVWWVEADPLLINPLTEVVGPYRHGVIQAAVSDRDDEVVSFNVMNEDQASSLLRREKRHASRSSLMTR